LSEPKNQWLRHATVGPHFIACLLVGWFLGNRCLDRWFDSFPLWTTVFLILGMVAAFVNLFRVVAHLNREDREERPDEPED